MSCATCTSSTSNCITCNTGYIFVTGTSGACVSTCPVGQYNTGSACTACDLGCAVCYGSANSGTGTTAVSTMCTSCKNDGTDNFYKVVNADACARTCPNGQFVGSMPFACSVCDVSCATCTSSS
jgi:proprotein convertase subtilisin/kexin type 5